MTKIERKIFLEATVNCCRIDDGDIAYTSEPNRMNYGETADSFEASLVMWRDQMLDFIAADLEETVDKELCYKIGPGSLTYCGQHTIMENISVEENILEEEVPGGVVVIPPVKYSEYELAPIRKRIKRIEEQMYGTSLEAKGRKAVATLKEQYGLE